MAEWHCDESRFEDRRFKGDQKGEGQLTFEGDQKGERQITVLCCARAWSAATVAAATKRRVLLDECDRGQVVRAFHMLLSFFIDIRMQRKVDVRLRKTHRIWFDSR